MVQTFAVFADAPTATKIRTAKVLMLVHAPPLYGVLRRVRAKVKTVKVSSGAQGVFAKVCTCKSFPLYGIVVVLIRANIISICVLFCL